MATTIRRVTEAERAQLLDAFLDFTAEFFDLGNPIYPGAIIDDPRADGEGEITIHRLLELIRLRK